MSDSRFNGAEYKTAEDHKRLRKQHDRIRDLMQDGVWRTLDEISMVTGDPAVSVSAQLRHLRKKRFGSWTVHRRARSNRDYGLYEYRLEAYGRAHEPSEKKETKDQKISRLEKRIAELEQQLSARRKRKHEKNLDQIEMFTDKGPPEMPSPTPVLFR